MWKLPRKEQSSEKPATNAPFTEKQFSPFPTACSTLSGCCRPAHQWRNTAHHSSSPRIQNGNPFHWRIDSSIEHDIQSSQEGYSRVDAEPQTPYPQNSSGGSKDQSSFCAYKTANEGSVTCATHLSIVFRLQEHIQSICRCATECSP